ncbi:Ubiquitin supergroup [Niveomyces insectorum RCEF 264]|uniref:Ubiquitin supergroup n=1 Tax=Niveomyces insectorum RCEF 264 TaxID=1081102 RepID=A0A162MNG8_9HYPO|nr:Ubiquitin supergroup [Niveomyces insectorum RCEF 264]
MAEPATTPPAAGGTTGPSPSELTVTLRLISPSRDLADFPVLERLPTATTIGQIKRRVEAELAARQRSSLGLRLIYRGRVLDVDEKTLVDVFGLAAIRETEYHTLHLVLRESGSSSNSNNGGSTTNQPFQFNQPLSPPTTTIRSGPSDAPGGPPVTGPALATNIAALQAHRLHLHQQPEQSFALPPFPGLPANVLAQHMDAHARAALELARQQIQVSGPSVPPPQPDTNGEGQRRPGSAQTTPDAAHGGQQTPTVDPTIRSRSVGPTYSTAEGQQRRELSPHEVEQILAAAEARTTGDPTQRDQAGTSSMPASAPPGTVPVPPDGAPFDHQPVPASDVYILASPTGPRALLIHGSLDAYYTPSTHGDAARLASFPLPPNPATINGQWFANPTQPLDENLQQELRQLQHNLQQSQQRNQHRHELIRMHMHHLRTMQSFHQLQQHQTLAPQLAGYPPLHPLQQAAAQHAQATRPGFFAPNVPVDQQQHHQQHQHQQQQQQQQHMLHPHVPHANLQQPPGLQPNNPGAGFLAAMWPHFWLLARLLLFVWWFTAPSATWSRWAMVVLLATAVFVVNTGMLDGLANQAWAPVRRHLDDLLSFANTNGGGARNGPNGAGPVPQNADNNNANGENGAPDVAVPTGQAGGPEPDPAEAAARLVARRRQANGARLMNLARRLERVGIMFLASLAPGIAERHVALVEEEERAERRRQQEAEEAAAAAAAAAAEAAATEASEAAAAENQEDVATAGNADDADDATAGPTTSEGGLEQEPQQGQQLPAQPQDEPLIAL